jgi:hypothetical protein
MNELHLWAGFVLAGYGVWVVVRLVVYGPGLVLQKKFETLGQLPGRTKEEIVAVVGQPNSISTLPDGKTLLQWQQSGYHIALQFSDGRCDSITHQHSGLA